MTIELIGIIALLAGFVSLFFEPALIVSVFLCTSLLGSAGAFTLPALGDTNISPAHLLLGFLAIKLLSTADVRSKLADGMGFGRPGFWLLIIVIYSLISAYFMPRIFAGQTFIFPARTTGYSLPLEPATANLTQSVYLLGDFICFILLYAYATTRARRRVLGTAALVCATLNLVFAALDLVTYFTNTAELLSFIRNANYGLLNDTELAGFKRIVGSFAEASAFGSMTVGLFAFTSRLWLLGVKPRLTLLLTILSFCALLFSTSTTAWVGLAGFLAVVYIETVLTAIRKPVNSQTMLFVIGAPIVVPILMFGIALNEDSAAYVQNLLDTLVFNKLSTDSGIERSSWNTQGLQNFLDTYGFGVGNGSMRASSYPVGVLASLGIVGAVTVTLFLVSVLFSDTSVEDSDPLDKAFRQAAKYTCVAWLITETVSGALVDLGLPFFVFAALACAKPKTSEVFMRQDELPPLPRLSFMTESDRSPARH
jgi:O-Antigen ligase